jgi:hypothetical protein
LAREESLSLPENSPGRQGGDARSSAAELKVELSRLLTQHPISNLIPLL